MTTMPHRKLIRLTSFAQAACDELGKVGHFVILSSMDIHSQNDRVKKKHPRIENPNAEYTSMALSLLGEFGVCTTVNVYQWYNREVLRLAAKSDLSIVKQVLSKKQCVLIANDATKVDAVVNAVTFKDKVVRTHLHEALGLWEEEEMELLVELRNCLVHHLGVDSDGRVKGVMQRKRSPWKLPIGFEGDKVKVTLDTADVATQIGLAQISIMDQQISNRFQLPVAERKSQTFSRIWA